MKFIKSIGIKNIILEKKMIKKAKKYLKKKVSVRTRFESLEMDLGPTNSK